MPASVDPSAGQELLLLKGVKEKRRAALVEEGICSITDLLWYVPYGYIDRSAVLRIDQLRDAAIRDPKREVTIVARVVKVEPIFTRHRRKFLVVTVTDESGYSLKCYWFNGIEYMLKTFEVGETLAFSSIPEWSKNRQDIIFSHPQFERFKRTEEGEPDWDAMYKTGRIIPKYSTTARLLQVGIDSSEFRRIIRQALRGYGNRIEECLPMELRRLHRLADRRAALEAVHLPESVQAVQEAHRRLSFDELFFLQLMYARLRKERLSRSRGRTATIDGPLYTEFMRKLPFPLTGAQVRVIEEIKKDVASSRPMERLLQGDVGSGKTIVALAGCLLAIDSGCQAAFMAPTEILAEQHYRTASALLAGIPINVRLLVGGQKKKLRDDVLQDIHSGRASLVIGTHALLEEKVEFASLGFVVIDEQHRFGVEQRAALASKGRVADVLVMSATPIPRTLQMAKYSDLDVSRLDEMPPGRKPIRTVVLREAEKQRIFEFIRKEAASGRQAYVVYPLIDESDKVEWRSAIAHYEQLRDKTLKGLRIGLLHGRLKPKEKDEVMRQFKERELDVLVATTVIEVGIDVPNATVMVIENADRFGLAQLHQLRGRVGRGEAESFCVLLASLEWSKEDQERFSQRAEKIVEDLREGRTPSFSVDSDQERSLSRLFAMQGTTDGFMIAEMDLLLRSSFFLTFDEQQSGVKRFRFVEFPRDTQTLVDARASAFALIDRDPQLRHPDHQIIAQEFTRTYSHAFDVGKTI